MSVDSWLSDQLSAPQDISSPPSLDSFDENDKENCRSLRPFIKALKRKRNALGVISDNEQAPRPAPKQSKSNRGKQTQTRSQTRTQEAVPDLARPSSELSAGGTEDNTTLESHQSGRISPTKQLMVLQDAEEPTLFFDFGWPEDHMAEDAEALRDAIQPLADNRGILGHSIQDLAHLTGPDSPLHPTERKRFGYPEARNPMYSELGTVVPLERVQKLVHTAMQCEIDGSHEDEWNQKIHWIMITVALECSLHERTLDIISLKTASIDPKSLASVTTGSALPKRVIDYAFVLKPDAKMSAAYPKLQPLPGAKVKSWNNVTINEARRRPIAVNLETKNPNKSWTDGKAQLAIWFSSLITRLRKLPDFRSLTPRLEDIEVPAMPVIIAQGHDWHLLIVSQVKDKDTGMRKTLVWQKLDIGSTRTCFDAYKIVAVLHHLANWAEKTWRPWWLTMIDG